ncbi:MAG: amino acid adenylation domain-containing protein [Sphingomonadales bacterium]|nr:amino acid adenylation domain-containing protein [Sphingomonadales bacterium]MDE2171461.1 amino acid adenylation domain-containing protein [Sphingomonadales bacterium]
MEREEITPLSTGDPASLPQDDGAQMDAIAIVAMTGRFPGARNVAQFWDNQRRGTVSITHFTDAELEDSFDAATRADPDFVRARGVLADADLFDADVFGMYAREAALTDPQHRIFLEIAQEALDLAGLDPRRYPGLVGVFAGASMPTYLINNVLADREAAARFTSTYQLDDMQTLVGALPETLASRVAYKLDLRGPAMTVQSACSTSALAVAQACQNLLNYQCDVALAGGVSITFPQQRGYLYQDGGMGSRDGTCRPFDAQACGTVFGAGAGVVVLKRLADALADGDDIHAVIRGYGVSNDGASKIGFTAPSAEGQASAIAAALAQADVDPASIGYVELHGTATPLGDPIEFDGLMRVFGGMAAQGNCVLGSAKANVGHLDAAAGVTGLIRAALCLRHGEIPPLANYTAPNPHIALADSPFRIETALTPWPRQGMPRRAGVSSFGVGGTNVHLVLEEAPAAAPRNHGRDAMPGGVQVLPLSARAPAALEAMAQALGEHLRAHPELVLADVAFTLDQGRTRREERGAVVASSLPEAVEKLAGFARRGIKARVREGAPVIFMFPGQGSQYPGMTRGLYQSEPVFRDWIDRGAQVLMGPLGLDIRHLLYEVPAGDDDHPHPIRSTVYAQPALFLTQYALARLFMARQIQPSAMIGHSVGELVAACLAGVMSFEDGLMLIARRAGLMQEAAAGAMLAVRTSEADLLPLLGDDLDLAAANAPGLCVAAGPFDAIAALETRLATAEIECRRLHTSHAFHSRMMDPVVDGLEEFARGMGFADPLIPYVSSVNGQWVTTAPDGTYWAGHCRNPVRFADALARVTAGDAAPILLEVGPGRALTTFAVQGLARDRYVSAITSLPDFAEADKDVTAFNEAIARLWTLGIESDLAPLYGEQARRVTLPPYPFQRQSHWIAAPATGVRSTTQACDDAQPSVQLSSKCEPEMTTNAQQDRAARLSGELAALFEDLSGEALSADDWSAPFLELGFDSLFLGQVAAKVQRQFGVKLVFRQLLSDFPTIADLARHLDANLAPDPAPAHSAAATTAPVETVSSGAPAAPAPAAPAPASLAPALPTIGISTPALTAPAVEASGVAGALQAQLAAMQAVIGQQLAFLGGQQQASAPALPAQQSLPVAAVAPGDAAAPPRPADVLPATAGRPEASVESPSAGRFRPFNAKAANAPVTERQRALIADLTARYCARMPGSKAQTQQHRAYFADPRSVSGFRADWKDMVFPVVASRSKGSKIWDVDGHEYVDLVNGYGQTAFGHAPDFVQAAVAQQLEEGFAIGPQTPLAGQVALQFSRMVGMERVTFCNTGSEAVMAAMRLARCVTGRDTVVVFNNDYHGQFDEVLVKSGCKPGTTRAFPIAPGIPDDSIANMVVLSYGSAEALDWIRAHGQDIAAVIVEPVQSRHPELLPFDFLRDLRAITAENEAALVFDEVVTGFRTHPGGMQAVLGIRADMATYGKVVGGGMPVGVLAGAARFMDALDGGYWAYGDDSVPEVAPTFFAGTFVRHPLVMAACKAVLDHLEEQGPQLQQQLAARTAGLVRRLNDLFTAKGVPSRVETYSSWFMLNLAGADRLGALFHVNMRLLGVHVLDGYPCFLTTAHSDADIDHIVEAARATIDLLQGAGILATQGSHVADPAPATAAATVPAGPREVPLTAPQMEILLSAQMGPQASCAYNESMTLNFDGAVDPILLEGAIGDFIARHDAMRATIPAGRTVLAIAPSLAFDLPVTEAASAEQLAQAKAEEAVTAFDLSSGPLLRARLFRMADGTSALLLTAHHIVFDGWTANLFAQEVAAFYRARATGVAPQLDPVESFADYALAKAGASEANAQTRGFWLDTYATIPAPLELCGDRPRPAIKSFSGATATTWIDATLMRDAQKAGAKLGCTLFATLLGTLQATIGRLADQEDVVIGCPMAGQALVEDKALAGHCVNFLPLRAPFTMATPLGDHLKAVKAMLMTAFDHQDYTYGALVRALKLPRDPNRTPLTDIQFNLESLGEGIDFGGASASLVPNPKAAVNFDLFFNVVQSAQGLRIDIDYSPDLFDEATVLRWSENLRQTLRALVADAATPIGEIDILGAQERQWLLARNPVLPRLPDDCTIVQRFAQAAAAHAGRVALVTDEGQMSYGELDALSSRMAHALMARGTGRGDFVALLSGRSIEAIVMILAVLKTGAAYVPLDPAYPMARQTYVLEDCKAQLVLVGPGAEQAVAQLQLADMGVSYAALLAEAAGHPAAAPVVALRGDDPIYVMYTSGSTGRPKGVVVPHRGVVRLVVDQDYIAFGPEQIFLHLAPLSFDASTLEIWGALLHGGAMAIVPAATPSLAEIGRACATHGATTAWFTAALFHALVDEGVGVLSPLRQILAGGDVVSPIHLRRAQEALSHTRFVNGYGPTENTTFSACYRVPADQWDGGLLPIGQPIARTCAYVMDDRLQLCPQGMVGELLVGGEGLALGYLSQTDMTAQRFVANPFAPGERLYRTGDLARWRGDGMLEFLGRMDGQVKLNGQRVEPGEIESVLREVAGVRDAAVIVTGSGGDTRHLHAFLLAMPDAPQEAQLVERARKHMASVLLRHMQPRTIRLVSRLPLTMNGKVDQAALQRIIEQEAGVRTGEPEPVGAQMAPAAQQPRTAANRTVELLETEARVGAIWAEVLGLDTIETDDAIFDLGADSLQIFRIAARMADIGLELDNRRLLANPTLGEVAAMLSGEQPSPVPSRPASAVAPLSAYRRGGLRGLSS